MYFQRSQPQQIYTETPFLLRPNNFLFVTRYLGDTHCLMYKI